MCIKVSAKPGQPRVENEALKGLRVELRLMLKLRLGLRSRLGLRLSMEECAENRAGASAHLDRYLQT